MTIIANAQGYDWQTWLMGIMRSFIGGGAGAAASAIGTGVVHPEDLHGGLLKLLAAMTVSFLFVGLVHMLIFLKTHAGPEKIVPVKDGGV
jgi:hypothetical protein